MAHRLAPQAEADLDDIWYYLAKQSGSIEVADRLIDSITNHFWMLARYAHLGRRRDHDLRNGVRIFPVGEHVVLYRTDGGDVHILRLVRGTRDILALLND